MVHPAPDPAFALHDNPIAIVGLGALYPKSQDLREFWSNIVEAADCIEDVPASHWRIEDHYDPDPAAPDKTYVKRGGFIPTVDFDPIEFGLPPNQLEVTDVLQLLSLVVAKQTLADAGAPGSSWYDPGRTGVVLGITGANSLTQPLATRLQTPVLKEVVRSCGLSDVDADEIAAKFVKAFAPWEENSFPGMLGNVVAGRIANRFDLGGTNCTVDAACASSLAAVHLAVLELVSGRADLMITGGCDAENTILMYLCFSKTPAFSKSGAIRPFDDASDGTLIGEGTGMLALKRLADAERDGNRIYAVINGIGTSSDGRYKSIYAPRREGQVVALNRAYQDAGFGPDTVGLVECHGTGTPVGDLTELTALRDVYSASTADTRFCAVGSVKSQIGHTKAAAGAAAMIKVALALHQKVLPPTINVEKPRAAVDFESSPFYVNSRTRPWLVDPVRPQRRAALSSFGFGGTNYHCVLAEHAASSAPQTLHRTAQVRVWHAPTVDELIAAVRAEPGGSEGGPIPPDAPRLAVVGTSAAELARSAAAAADRLAADPSADAFNWPGAYYRRSALPDRKLAALFAGQGSQYVGMGAATAVGVPPVRAELDAACLVSGANEPLNRVVFPPPAFDPGTAAAQEVSLRRTEFAQPAIGALSAGQFRWLTELGLTVDGTLGHSFGELTALWAAGSLSDADFRALAAARGQAMAARPGDTDRGTMAAVGCSADDAIRLATGLPGIAICNLNSPRQIVVGGPEAVVRGFVAAAGREGFSATVLPVDAAFHTAVMAPYVTGFAVAVERVEVGPPVVPVYPNTHDAQYGADPVVNRRVLVGQLTRPVHFSDRLEQMYRDGFRVFVEFGPKSVLSGLVRQTLGDRPGVIALSADAGPGSDGDVALKQLAARLVVLGVPLDRINRYAAPVPAVPERRGMRIPLNGINYVSEQRRRDYADALENGYRVTAPAAPASSSSVEDHIAGRAARPTPEEEKPTMSTLIAESPPLAPAPTTGPAPADPPDWLALHQLFLVGQQQLTDRLTQLLNATAGTALSATTAQAIIAVAEHGEAVARSHGLAMRALCPGAEAETEVPVEIAPAPGVPAVGRIDLPAEPVPVGISGQQPIVPVPASVVAPAVVIAPVVEPVVAPAAPVAPSGQRPQIEAALLEIVSAKTGYPTDMLDIGMDVEADLGIDSIKRVEILGALHDRFPEAPSASPEQLGELRSLLDIVTFLDGDSPASGRTEGEVSLPKADGAPQIARMQARLTLIPAADRLVGGYRNTPIALVAGHRPALAERLAQSLRADGWTVHVGGSVPADLDRLDLVMYLAPREVAQAAAAKDVLTEALLLAGRTAGLLQVGSADRTGFLTVSSLDGALGMSGADGPTALLGGLAGLAKTLGIEAPSVFCRAVDLHPSLSDDQSAALLLTELHDPEFSLRQVGIDAQGRRCTVELTPTGPDRPARVVAEPGSDDLILVTGGGRGITAACAAALAERFGCALLLVGRTQLIDEPSWLADHPVDQWRSAIATDLRSTGARPTPRDVERRFRDLVAAREVRELLAGLADRGVRATYLAVDVTDAAATGRALTPYRARITGLVHGAGVLSDQLVVDKREADVRCVLDAKLTGLTSVLDAVDVARLQHVVLFSSVAGFFGNRGQSDYAMANEGLNRVAVALRRRLPTSRVTAINWGAWAGGMVTPALEQMFAERGIPLIPLAVGVGMFVEQFTAPRGDDLVCVIGPNTPLSTTDGPPARPMLVRRLIQPLLDDPAMQDHALGGRPVLPAVVALGAMLNLVGRAHGTTPRLVTGFQVLKGVVEDGGEPAELDCTLTPVDGGIQILAADSTGRPRYRATVVHGVPDPVRPALPATANGQPATVYSDGALFHGPAWQGIRRLVTDDESGLVVTCRRPVSGFADGGTRSAGFDPATADQLLQAALVLHHRRTGVNSLPTGIQSIEVHGTTTDDDEFLVVVEPVGRTDGASVRVDVTACRPDGRVLLRFTGVELVPSPGLSALFRAPASLAA